MKTKICLLCNKEFKKPYFKSIESWGQVKYCSIKCYGLSKRKANPIHCDNCSKEIYVKPSLLKKHKRHFCSMICRANFVKTLPFTEQNAYKGVRKEGESKQVYHRNYCKNNRDNISHLVQRKQNKMTPTEVKQAADEMVEMFLKEIGDTCEHSAYCMKPECSFNGNSHCMVDISTAVSCAIAHCKRVIKEWGCAYGMVAPQYQTECASKIKYYQSILSELEGRVK